MRKLISFVIFFSFVTTSIFSQAVISAPVLEGIGYKITNTQVSSWLNAIDHLYATYDLVNNSINSIENQYKQINQAIENAKSIDWESIQWDGDFDIRNDILNGTKKVNQLLSQVQVVKDSINTPTVSLGQNTYSLKDLCSHKMLYALEDFTTVSVNSFANAGKSLAADFTDAERTAIMRKWGISPNNYAMVLTVKHELANRMAEALANASEEAKKLSTDPLANSGAVLQAFIDSKNAENGYSTGAYQEANLRILTNLQQGLVTLDDAIKQITELYATNLLADQKDKEAEQDRKEEEEKIQSYSYSSVPNAFKN